MSHTARLENTVFETARCQRRLFYRIERQKTTTRGRNKPIDLALNYLLDRIYMLNSHQFLVQSPIFLVSRPQQKSSRHRPKASGCWSSTLQSLRVVQKHAEEDNRICIIDNDHCPDDWAGKCNAAKLGAAKATGDWLLFTDSDTKFDVWTQTQLAKKRKKRTAKTDTSKNR